MFADCCFLFVVCGGCCLVDFIVVCGLLLVGRCSLVAFRYSSLFAVCCRLFAVYGVCIVGRCWSLFVVRCLFSVCRSWLVLYVCVWLLGACCVSFGGCRFSLVVCCPLFVFRRSLLVVRWWLLYLVFSSDVCGL